MKIIEYIVSYGFSLSLLANALLFIPQIISILKKKSAREISLLTFAGFNIIQLFTILHGIHLNDYLLAGGYLLSLLTGGTVTVLILYFNYFQPYKKRSKANKNNQKAPLP